MGFFDRIERAASTGFEALRGAIGGFAGGLLDFGESAATAILREAIPQAIPQLAGALVQRLPGGAPTTIAFGGISPTVVAPTPFAAGVPFPMPDVTPLLPPIGVTEPSRMPLNLALPGGAQVSQPGALEQGLNWLFGTPSGGVTPMPTNGVQLWNPTATSIRPARVIVVSHPQTGAPVFFGHLGRPLLWSRDLSAARRVDRLARRARRVRRGR